MLGEFFAIVSCNRAHTVFVCAQQVDACVCNESRCFTPDVLDACKSGLPFHDRHQCLLVILSNHGVGFPMTKLFATLNNLRSETDRPAVGNDSTCVPDSIAFTTLAMPATKVCIQPALVAQVSLRSPAWCCRYCALPESCTFVRGLRVDTRLPWLAIERVNCVGK